MADDDYFNTNDDVDVDEEPVCKVYSNEDHFTAFVQVLLAAFALLSLYYKRQQERPRRKFWTWFLDISKQGIGAVYAHCLNMVIAAIIARNVRGDFVLEDECAWYAINYLIDTTLGLLLSIVFLGLLDWIANERDWVALKHSGVYEGADGLWHWFWQCTAFVWVLTIVKVIICIFMWLISPLLAKWGQIFFSPLQGNIRFELLFVMIIFPGFLNVLYFWVIDSFLRASKHHASAHEDHHVELCNAALASRSGDSKNEALVPQYTTSSRQETKAQSSLEKEKNNTQQSGEVTLGYVQPNAPATSNQSEDYRKEFV
mmetsp:Transcript_12074/g.15078  ORF Transcript_12074/g.15078 Transcript_12074/m.15078 type:complete len:314 (-) Transcript_12074:251-1192(-)|eukprot:CAMPEP_0172504178 /NCGR_PEP_ID=MMETSP1066-20121228/176175_1 /TAXON_ID=671091 /ORGANISM="Coscinodiscus wailesii, Strain CCMP2513" /LENGTH=313 /DNA_ID=CAMNT_0013280237 /DNA_START=33 /DNA_END=974 /DNA_ORIENTATION=+